METTTQTKSERMAEVFRRGGFPFKKVDVFGSHCIVTCHSDDAARRIAHILQLTGWEITGGPKRCCDDAKENKGTCLLPTKVEVYRIWARIKA